MHATLPLRIFLATPGDLSDERQAIKATVAEHNSRRRGVTNVQFEVVGWEQKRGSAQRPQDAINELIRESHFMIVMFKEKWGSEPGGPWGYTSGTEEELFTGLLELGQEDQPMRDVWVAFMAHATPEERVTQLKNQMIREHAMLFETTGGLRELKEKLSARLISWENTASVKRPRHIDLISSTGLELLKAAKLRIAGTKLVDLGQTAAGHESLKDAATIGGPAESLAYAQFLARRGDFDEAYKFTQNAINQCLQGSTTGPYSSLMAEAIAAQAGVLRRQGKDIEAVGRLKQALTLFVADDPFTYRVRSRIFDELGIAHQSLGQFADAKKAFRESLEIRQKHLRAHDIAQSYVNLARVAVADKNLPVALAHAKEAEKQLLHSAPTSLHANAATLLAQIHIRLGEPESGIPHAESALALNQQFANKRGEAIALLLLAQSYRAANKKELATNYAQKCLQVNTEMEDEAGAKRAQWLLNELGDA